MGITGQEPAELKRAEEAWRRAEADSSNIFKNAVAGIFQTTPEGRVIKFNPALAGMLGYESPEEAISSIDQLSLIYVQPSRRDELKEMLEERGVVQGVEAELYRKDGSTLWVSLNTRAVRDESGAVHHYEGALVDITERKRVEEELRRAKEQLDATIDALPDLMFEVDREGRICEYRAPRTGMLYAPPDRFIGRTVSEVLPEDAAGIIMDAVGEAARTGRHRGAIYSLAMQQGTCWFELSIASKGDLDSPDGRMVALVRDITERKQAEEELREYREDLERLVSERTSELEDLNKRLLTEIGERELAERELIRVNRELESYARTVSHELRTPLTGIYLALEYLERLSRQASAETFNEEAKAIVEKAKSTVEGAEMQVERLLELARAGQVPTELSDVEVSSVVEGILSEVDEQLVRRGAGVKADGELGRIRANPTHIHQVFSNLIVNAVKHCDSREPLIEISLLGENSGGGHRYLVRDNGSGIPPELIDGLFGHFVKAKGGASGTGLAIVEKIIRIYSGSIRAYNDNGACFEFVLYDYRRTAPLPQGDH
jgi:PAS domain S-box-containing protein